MATTISSLWTGLIGTARVPLNGAADILHRQEGGVVGLIAVVQMLLLVEVNAGIAKLSLLLMKVAMTLRPAGTIGMMSGRGRPSLPSPTVGVDGIGRHKVLLVLQGSIGVPGAAAPTTRGRRSSSSVGKVVSVAAILGQVLGGVV